MKLCNGPCGIRKPLDQFGKRTVDGKQYPETYCYKCSMVRKQWYKLGTRERRIRTYKRDTARQKAKRASPEHRAIFILKDLRKNDKVHGRLNDLDLEFVRAQIKQECVYCGVKPEESRISLDRIDNSLGHVRNNVAPACIACNLTRGNMPYAAWAIVATAMRQVRKLGLLTDWKVRK
jgi:hypothetical protein